MPPSNEKNTSFSSKLKAGNKKKFLIIGAGVVSVIVIIGSVYWFVIRKETSPSNNVSSAPSEQLESTLKSDREQLYAVPAYDDSPAQQFMSLTSKSVTAKVGQDWAKVEDFSKQALALSGYENDINTLTRLLLSYEMQNKTQEYKETLSKLRKSYETQQLTDTDEYKALPQESN